MLYSIYMYNGLYTCMMCYRRIYVYDVLLYTSYMYVYTMYILYAYIHIYVPCIYCTYICIYMYILYVYIHIYVCCPSFSSKICCLFASGHKVYLGKAKNPSTPCEIWCTQYGSIWCTKNQSTLCAPSTPCQGVHKVYLSFSPNSICICVYV